MEKIIKVNGKSITVEAHNGKLFAQNLESETDAITVQMMMFETGEISQVKIQTLPSTIIGGKTLPAVWNVVGTLIR